MKLKFDHLKEVDETYISHFKFACKLGIGLSYRAAWFLIHGFIPAIEIPENFNLSATIKWAKKAKKHRDKKNKTI